MNIAQHLSPIKTPDLVPLRMDHQKLCRDEAWTTMMLLWTCEDIEDSNFEFDPETNGIYVLEMKYHRLWILEHGYAVVAYYTCDHGSPFFWFVDSLLKKSKTDSWDFTKVDFHVSCGVEYSGPSEDVLPDENGMPVVLTELRKRKLIAAKPWKSISDLYQQLKFETMGFQMPDKTRQMALTALVGASRDTSLSTVLKTDPEAYRAIVIQGEIDYAKTEKFEPKEAAEGKAGVQEEELPLVGTAFIREEDGSVTRHHFQEKKTQAGQ